MLTRLVLRHLQAHPVRSLLTVGSVALAVFLLCLLRATVASLTSAVDAASTSRLWVQSAVSLYVDLPLSYEGKIAGVPGVERVCKFQWFGANYRGERVSWAQFGIDPEDFAPSYPEIEIAEGSYDAFAADRAGCMVGVDLASQNGWQVGDRVPLEGTIFQRSDGGPWEFNVRAIYRSHSTNVDNRTMYFQFGYLHESLEQGAARGPRGSGVYTLRLGDGAEPTQVAAAVDAMFAGGPQRVQTTTEAEFQRQFVTMLGGVPTLLGAIGGAVLFAIFFAVLNTMLMAGRERVRESGILKALGFRSGTMLWLLLAEALVVCVGGAGIGIGLVVVSESTFRSMLAGFLPGFVVPGSTIALGLGIAAAVGVVSGLVPGLGLRRLRPVQALRRTA